MVRRGDCLKGVLFEHVVTLVDRRIDDRQHLWPYRPRLQYYLSCFRINEFRTRRSIYDRVFCRTNVLPLFAITVYLSAFMYGYCDVFIRLPFRKNNYSAYFSKVKK